MNKSNIVTSKSRDLENYEKIKKRVSNSVFYSRERKLNKIIMGQRLRIKDKDGSIDCLLKFLIKFVF